MRENDVPNAASQRSCKRRSAHARHIPLQQLFRRRHFVHLTQPINHSKDKHKSILESNRLRPPRLLAAQATLAIAQPLRQTETNSCQKGCYPKTIHGPFLRKVRNKRANRFFTNLHQLLLLVQTEVRKAKTMVTRCVVRPRET